MEGGNGAKDEVSKVRSVRRRRASSVIEWTGHNALPPMPFLLYTRAPDRHTVQRAIPLATFVHLPASSKSYLVSASSLSRS